MLCWIDSVWSSKECACCASDPSVRLDAPSICLPKVISSFKSLTAGLQVLVGILHFGMLCLSVISMMFVKIRLTVCMLVFFKLFFTRNNFIAKIQQKKIYIYNIVITVELQMRCTLYIIKIIVLIMNH